MPTFFDAFSGVGGFRLAFENEGYECVGYCEIDKYARRLYEEYFNISENEFVWHDIMTINVEDMPNFDIITAGVPCQPFSYAGRRGGLNDERGINLWRSLFNIVRSKKPKIILIENVKGLLSTNRGRDFAWILFQMAEMGYGVEWMVLNSKDFGVPQNRERVFIIGHLGNGCPAKVFPIREDEKAYYTPPEREHKIQTSTDICPTITARYYKLGNSDQYIAIYDPYNKRLPADQKTCTTLRTNYSNGNAWIVKWCKYPFTLTENINMDNIKIRKLTPLECFRLQGFPDDIVFKAREIGISDTQLYKMAGNAVTVQVVQSIARKLKLIYWR